ncbi:uncharacterized protein si:dkey-262k9.2 isoform X1 [Gadus macrocephalus]|uniref:uncharacterized protein si:dkey-262k9.2 isoform X1 n=1 Tax=Gadus macrocephalus TaxID=80720 RepID=UPI0028CB555F|nr:uncharacterized protein si:dkey-262k9.2 isoform X1 [Gadus macrocephalus]
MNPPWITVFGLDLKMMLLLLLCLLLPSSTALSKEVEGSADDPDDEDLIGAVDVQPINEFQDPDMGKTTGGEESDQFVGIVVGVAVAMVALSVAVIIAILLVRRNMQRRQQGVYSVPADQDQKVSV